MAKLIDLRPDKNLANSNFEKYQFCSVDIPTKFEKKLQTEVLQLELSTSQDSWLEARLFAFHNHLFKNPYNSNCYFIDKEGQIWCFKLDGSLDVFYKSTIFNSKSLSFIYNPSIAFASEDICIVCNGGGSIEFLVKDKDQVKNFLFTNVEPAVIFDTRYIEQSKKIIVALYKVEENDNKKFSRIIILSYNYEKNIENDLITIEMFQKQKLKVKGVVDYIHVERNGKFFHVISQDQVEFEHDSVNPIKSKEDISLKESDIKIPKYCWSQDEDSITVYIKIPEECGESAANVEVTHFNVSIKVGDKILLSGETANKLESNLTTWKRKDNNIELELAKCESGLMWNELIKGDTGGEYLPNEALATEIHARLSHLCSSEEETNRQGQPTIGFNSEQLEECDLSGDDNILQRININSHTITHMAMLGSSNRVLFAQKQLFGQAICVRYDHDGCIWIMKESENDDWDLEHTHTYPGFGYVEASKTNKKFCVSPPDGSYIAIVEHSRHAFLYEKPETNTKVGKQKIIDFGSGTSPILGATATNKYLIILTKNSLYQLQVYS